MGSQLDGLLTQLGTGRWNYLYFAAISYCVSLPTYHTLGGAFLAPKVEHECIVPSFPDKSTRTFISSSNLLPSSSSINLEDHKIVDSCNYQEITSTGELKTEPCTDWKFDNSTFSTTVTSEYQLVCGREYLRATYTSIYLFGVLVGAPLNGFLADKYGRKPTVTIGSIMYSVIAIGSSWLPSLSLIMIARFLLGTMHSTMIKTAYILAMEVTEPRLRSVMGIVLYLPWGLATMALGGFAYLVRDWRWLQLLMSLLTLLFLPSLFLLEESPRWLGVRGYHSHALRVLKKAAKWNRVPLPPPYRILHILRQGQIEARETRSTNNCGGNSRITSYYRSAFILFRSPQLRKITIGMFINYLVVGMVYFGLSLNGGNLSNNPFMYMVLMGVMEVPAYTIMVPVVDSFGRRAPIIFFFFFSGVVLLFLPFIPTGCSWLGVVLAMVGKMTITSAFQIISLYSSELFPTEVRTRGTSTAFMMSRVGSTCSPFITEYLEDMSTGCFA